MTSERNKQYPAMTSMPQMSPVKLHSNAASERVPIDDHHDENEEKAEKKEK